MRFSIIDGGRNAPSPRSRNVGPPSPTHYGGQNRLLNMLWKPLPLNIVEAMAALYLDEGMRVLVVGYRARAFACLLQEDYRVDCHIVNEGVSAAVKQHLRSFDCAAYSLRQPDILTTDRFSSFHAYFDVVICLGCLSMNEETFNLLADFKRLTIPGGAIIVTDYFLRGDHSLPDSGIDASMGVVRHCFQRSGEVWNTVSDGSLALLAVKDISDDTEAVLSIKLMQMVVGEKDSLDLLDGVPLSDPWPLLWLRAQLRNQTLSAEIMVLSRIVG